VNGHTRSLSWSLDYYSANRGSIEALEQILADLNISD